MTNLSSLQKAKKPVQSYSRKFNLELADQTIPLPTFMPVGTRASVKGLTPDQVRSTGAQIVLGNTYHLHIHPGEAVVQQAGGLAAFSGWQGSMLTDSGGFQVFSLAGINKITDEGVWFKNPENGDEIFLSPEKSIQIQHQLGADIIMAFDDVVDLSQTARHRTQEAFERTHRWLERSIAEHKRLSAEKQQEAPDYAAPKLFGIVQGGLKEALRKESLQIVQTSDVDGVAIGGLSVGESRQEMHSMLDFLAPLYRGEKPRYLMGVGHPVDLRYGIERGIDMFDCVLPTRNARHGTGWILRSTAPELEQRPDIYDPFGLDLQVNFKSERFKTDLGPIEAGCDCYACTSGFSRSLIRHLLKVGESLGGQLLSIHNLRYLQRICEQYKS